MNASAFNENLTTACLLARMKHAEIYPLPKKIQTVSLATICTGLKILGLPVTNEDESRYWMCHGCQEELPTRIESVDLIVEVVKSHCGGLCLDCIRNGDAPGPGSASPGVGRANNRKRLQRAECRAHPAEPQTLLEHSCCSCYD